MISTMKAAGGSGLPSLLSGDLTKASVGIRAGGGVSDARAEPTSQHAAPSVQLQPTTFAGQPRDSAKTTAGEADVDDDVALTFPQRLMEILDNEENHHIISWLPHGRAFVIYRKKQFEAKILPKYFNKQSKYSSFTRKLNRWGFSRVTRGPESGAYYHQFFRRGGHRLVMQMSCHSGRPTKSTKATATAGAQPDLSGLVPTDLAGAAGVGSIAGLYPNITVQSLAAERAALQSQGNDQLLLLQMQLQQQALQQEMLRRAAMAEGQQLQLPQQQQVFPNTAPGVAMFAAAAAQQMTPQQPPQQQPMYVLSPVAAASLGLQQQQGGLAIPPAGNVPQPAPAQQPGGGDNHGV